MSIVRWLVVLGPSLCLRQAAHVTAWTFTKSAISTSPCRTSASMQSASQSQLVKHSANQYAHHVRKISDSFHAREYQCPWWAKNCHVHTIIGSGEVARRLLRQEGLKLPYRRERWTTPDDDFFDVDFYEQPRGHQSDKMAILTHGLESTSSAPLTSKMARAYHEAGFHVAVLCFRSCSGEDNKGPGAYHLGFTDDLDQVVRELHKRHPSRRLYLSGFSLGGNVICKYLGQLGERASSELGIAGGAVACVPFDAVGAHYKLDFGFNKAVYSTNFLKTLVPKMKRKASQSPELAARLDMERISKVTTIGEFDDAVIAPLYGYKSNIDYYENNQSGQFLKGVRVPLLAIQANDDPFMPFETYPTNESLEGAPVRLVYHDHGGHCAFISANKEDNVKGWLPVEMARFIEHVDTSMTQTAPTA